MNPGHRQQGVALIMALVIISLATVLAVAFVDQQQQSIQRSETATHLSQAWQYALGAEAWAAQILARDRKNSAIDSLDEVWAQDLPPLPVPGGQIHGQLQDLQARINLNDLVIEQKLDSITSARLQRLLRQLELEPMLVERLADWIDRDFERQPQGAEDETYLAQTPPYRSANQPFTSPAELRLLNGLDGEAYARLAPFVAALPDTTAVNVNTAPAEVLMTLDENLDSSRAEAVLRARQERPFADLAALKRLPELKDVSLDDSRLDVVSNYFLLISRVTVGSARLLLYSVLHRGADGTVRTLYRSQGTP